MPAGARRHSSRATAGAALLASALGLLFLASCRDASPTVPPLTTLTLPDTALLQVGEHRTLGASAQGGAEASFRWSTTDAAVAEVAGDGSVIALAPGSAWIVASSVADPALRDSVSVTVLPVVLAVTPSSGALLAGRTLRLRAAVAGAVDTTVLWRSSAPAVAAVSAGGVVAGVSTGSATITAMTRADTAVRQSVTVDVNLQLTLAAATITQVTQTPEGDVPLVAGRDGLLRVYVRANLPNQLTPAVRVRFYKGGALASTATLLPAAGAVPAGALDDSLAAPWTLRLPGTLIQPGLSMLVDVDPDATIPQPDHGQDVYPLSGTPGPLDVRVSTPMQVTFVPVLLAGATDAGDVTAANMTGYLADARRMFPIAAFDAALHPTFTSADSTATTQQGWSEVVSEILALQVAEGSDRLYYGVLRNVPGRAWCGLGFVGSPAAIGVDTCGSLVAAHEWGHNFGRFHAPCGNPANPDAGYPYPAALIGAWGYDAASGARYRPDGYVDVMSYCDPEWISDYTYRGIMDFRATLAARQAAQAAAPPAEVLLLWGHIDANGTPVLEPAFETTAPPALPAAPGPYTLTGLGDAGQRLFSLSFAASPLADAPRSGGYFAFAVPLTWAPGTLAQLRLASPAAATTLSGRGLTPAAAAAQQAVSASASTRTSGGRRARLQWDASTYRAALVRDAATGRVLAFARGGAADLDGAPATLDVTFSDGVRSVRRRVRVTP